MPTQNFSPLKGRLETRLIESDTLTNTLGDPVAREVVVYLPAGYDATDESYPLFVDLVGFTGSGLAHVG